MSSSHLDFKMLVVFKALIETGQVSAAADNLKIGQSNVSRALAKLREHFGDPLFVRTQKGMEPTRRAVQLAKSVDKMLHIYDESLQGHSTFDPATSHRAFHLTGSDVGHLLVCSQIYPAIFEQAPFVQLHTVPLGINTLAKQLETDTDIAFGPYPNLYAGIHERELFKEKYVCLARKGHPIIQGKMSLEQYRKCEHVVVAARRLGHQHEQIQNMIHKAMPRGRQRIATHSFVTAGLIAESTDFIATLPAGAGRVLAGTNLQVLPPPFELPIFPVKLYWHERFHQDPAHVWLRNLMYEAFAEDNQ